MIATSFLPACMWQKRRRARKESSAINRHNVRSISIRRRGRAGEGAMTRRDASARRSKCDARQEASRLEMFALYDVLRARDAPLQHGGARWPGHLQEATAAAPGEEGRPSDRRKPGYHAERGVGRGRSRRQKMRRDASEEGGGRLRLLPAGGARAERWERPVSSATADGPPSWFTRLSSWFCGYGGHGR